ncbi:centromere protein W-like [Mya arenaria]|uniref:centromere protein W-like n=1 Tax=Mya arenaria TaxID=6604 RepID=UPI0022E2B9F3|nr:centromere protein W-like [Mya arenaria]
MLTKLPTANLKKVVKQRFDDASLPKTHAMTWLNYQLFLQKLAKAAADNAREDKSAVIRAQHVRSAAKTILGSNKG